MNYFKTLILKSYEKQGDVPEDSLHTHSVLLAPIEARDKKMVDAADICLVVWDGIPAGGTYYTMRYAEEQGKEIRYFPWQ